MDSFNNELLDFMDGVNELDLMICPNCGSRNVYEMSTSEDNLVLHVECEDCDHIYDVDVSADALIKKYGELREKEK
jgi:transcription elongation factor Elf1